MLHHNYIIILISDGCGYNHVDAACFYQHGKIGSQIYQQFPVQLGMSTYPITGSYDPCQAWKSFDYVLQNPTDSSAAATTVSTGQKTYIGAIGIGAEKRRLRHVMERAEELGMMTGVVTSVLFSHATPAGFVTHNEVRSNYAQIAQEMLGNSAVDVVMGCGHPCYDNSGNEISDPCAREYRFVGGEEFWQEILAGTVASDADGDGEDDAWTLLQSLSEFESLVQTESPASRILGIPMAATALQYGRGGDNKAEPFAVPLNKNVPSLATMVRGALNVLDESNKGFVLMVEGGSIDGAAHGQLSGRVIEEEIDFNRAVEAVVEWVEANNAWNQTLVIVTGDHETGYLTGPESGEQENGPCWNAIVNNGTGNQPGMEWHTGGHTNSLIPFYAKGLRAEEYLNLIDGTDTIRGDYIDNSDLASVVFDLLQ